MDHSDIINKRVKRIARDHCCTVEDVHDVALHHRAAEALFADTGFDLRGQIFEHFFRTSIVGASAVVVGDGHLDITVWRDGQDEKVIRKH